MFIRIALSSLIGLTLAGCSTPAFARDPSGSDGSEGHKLYIAKCAKCHKFYDPAKYSEADWEMWITKMSKKSKLKPNQETELRQYISENLRRSNGTNAAALKR